MADDTAAIICNGCAYFRKIVSEKGKEYSCKILNGGCGYLMKKNIENNRCVIKKERTK